jgi:hypothetical protein
MNGSGTATGVTNTTLSFTVTLNWSAACIGTVTNPVETDSLVPHKQ